MPLNKGFTVAKSAERASRTSWLKPQITYGEIILLFLTAAGIMTSYFKLDAKVDVNDVFVRTRFAAYDKQFEAQKEVDRDQNERMIRAYAEMKAAVTVAQKELKDDIRDIRTDIAVRGVVAGVAPRTR